MDYLKYLFLLFIQYLEIFKGQSGVKDEYSAKKRSNLYGTLRLLATSLFFFLPIDYLFDICLQSSANHSLWITRQLLCLIQSALILTMRHFLPLFPEEHGRNIPKGPHKSSGFFYCLPKVSLCWFYPVVEALPAGYQISLQLVLIQNLRFSTYWENKNELVLLYSIKET